MQSIHFSMIDIVLIVATLQCALVFGLVVIARALPTPSPICRHLLGLLFIAIGMDAAAILLVWQADVRAALAPVAGLVIAFASFAFLVVNEAAFSFAGLVRFSTLGSLARLALPSNRSIFAAFPTFA